MIGIELNDPEGDSSGSIDGVQMFSCPDKHGIFVPRSQVKGLEFTGKKIMSFGCFEFEYFPTNNPQWKLQFDHMEGHGTPNHHCTLSPTTERIHCEYLTFSEKASACVRSLLSSGWKPHCIQIKAQAEPLSFDSSFDPELWTSCRVIYKYIDCFKEFHFVNTYSNILNTAQDCSYSTPIFLQNIESQAWSILGSLSLLMDFIMECHETDPISWLISTISSKFNNT